MSHGPPHLPPQEIAAALQGMPPTPVISLRAGHHSGHVRFPYSQAPAFVPASI